MIQSAHFVEGQQGFRIVGDSGSAEFHNATVRGHIEADTGFLNAVEIREQAVFLGTIKSGPVYISNQTTTPSPPQVFPVNSRIREIVAQLNAGSSSNTLNVTTGSFGNRQGLLTVITSVTTRGNFPNIITTWTLRLVFSDGTSTTLTAENMQSDAIFNRTIGQVLSIGTTTTGKIFRIDDLPVSTTGLPPSGLPVGTLYRHGNQLMVV